MFTARAVLRHSCAAGSERQFISSVYCESGIETVSSPPKRTPVHISSVYCESGIETVLFSYIYVFKFDISSVYCESGIETQ